jgi:hypothetical protein
MKYAFVIFYAVFVPFTVLVSVAPPEGMGLFRALGFIAFLVCVGAFAGYGLYKCSQDG